MSAESALTVAKEMVDTVEEETLSHRIDIVEDVVRSVKVERPFMLASRLVLREYQHFGLSWLVSLHERRLNGILADEMGLGKTIQTISLLAYLSCFKGIWGPHLIVVPSSCVVNWESEFKRWCPGFKILTYYGSAKARKGLRVGWSKMNSFHVCITSYQLVVQDASAFRRKQWYYMILDEAHNIKNFKSQRWQTLLNFNAQRRLLLTGTPLQNNLMELWSLMHFLMPHIFRSRKEFSYWFSNPLASMVEGNKSVNNDLIGRLHSIMRPFLLRRLKKDVEKQLPGKFEHIITCKLSKRQLYLYEEFMSRSSTRSSLTGGSYLGMMNILMQLRKVCNHPDLFEPRPILTPFIAETLVYTPPGECLKVLNRDPLEGVTLSSFMHLWEWDDAHGDIRSQGCTRGCQMERGRVIVPKLEAAPAAPVTKEEYIKAVFSNEKEDLEEAEQAYSGYEETDYAHFCRDMSVASKQRLRQRCEFNYKTSAWRSTRPTIAYNPPHLVTMETRFTDKVRRARSDALLAVQEITPCWYDLIKSESDRAQECADMIENFVFVLPKVLTVSTPRLVTVDPQYRADIQARHTMYLKLKPQVEKALRPFYAAKIRQTITFPERKLVQFDSGKLQRLASLLRELKTGNHKVLIFTQMSKMLDILEVFLNLHAHTYVRLDGATGLDKRQKMMDRFNSDPKLFVFILSTRSGGLGINLTGADCVIFYGKPVCQPSVILFVCCITSYFLMLCYTLFIGVAWFLLHILFVDSDWNPAMDAQAQDRAHRIGQTRPVHIYRFISSSTIEENILVKARQKRHLDHLVMTEGNFSEDSLFSADGLKGILGVETDSSISEQTPSTRPSNRAIADAMAAAEDEEDVRAMKGAVEEAKRDQSEFDEAVPLPQGDDDEGATGSAATITMTGKNKTSSTSATVETSATTEEIAAEEDFSNWQASVGPDFSVLQAALTPIERHALHIRTDVEPFYSMHFLTEAQKLEAMGHTSEGAEWDVEEIERQKEAEEARLLSEGELLFTGNLVGGMVEFASRRSKQESQRLQNWFLKERKMRHRQRRKRIQTGEGWTYVFDDPTKPPHWFNKDTGEVTYKKPLIIERREEAQQARQLRYTALPAALLINIFSYLAPYPDRMSASLTCWRWLQAAQDPVFSYHVLPVETGVRDNAEKMAKVANNEFVSVRAAVAASLPGQLLVLGSGHHWEDGDINCSVPLKLTSEAGDASKCIVELTGGSLQVLPGSVHVVMHGLTIRRPRFLNMPYNGVRVQDSKCSMASCIVDNDGGNSVTVLATERSAINMAHCTIKGGVHAGVFAIGSTVCAANTTVCLFVLLMTVCFIVSVLLL